MVISRFSYLLTEIFSYLFTEIFSGCGEQRAGGGAAGGGRAGAAGDTEGLEQEQEGSQVQLRGM